MACALGIHQNLARESSVNTSVLCGRRCEGKAQLMAQIRGMTEQTDGERSAEQVET